MKGKTERIDMRVHPELKSRVEELANCLSKSRNKVIEDAIWSYVLAGSERFAICPTCKKPCFDKEEMPITEGVGEVTCIDGHTHLYDFEKEKFV